jgi:hypothetical protein
MRDKRSGRLLLVATLASVVAGVGAAILWTRSIRPQGDASSEGRAGNESNTRSRSPRPSPKAYQPSVRLSLSPAQASIPGLSLDPNAPEYDARKLIKLLGNVKSVFDSEPRNPSWAEQVESRITPQYERSIRSIVPAVQSLKMECRTTMCAVHLTLSEDDPETRQQASFVAVQLFPGIAAPTKDGGLLIRYDDLTWKGDVRDTEAFIARAQAQLARSTELMHRLFALGPAGSGTGHPNGGQ